MAHALQSTIFVASLKLQPNTSTHTHPTSRINIFNRDSRFLDEIGSSFPHDKKQFNSSALLATCFLQVVKKNSTSR